MIKRITSFLLLYLSVISFGYAQVQVGTGNNMEQKVPYNAAFGLSYGQSIYLSSEINASGTITTIQWYYTGNGILDNSQDLDIYIGNTTKTVFANPNDWEPFANLTLVYSGGITTGSAPGWKTITLDTPFVYDGTSNLIVAVDDNQEGSDSYPDKFYNSPVSGIRSMAVWGDSNDINPANPPEAYADYGGFVAYVPNIIFGGITQSCPTPLYVTASNVITDSATISWQAPATSPSGGSDYYISTSSTDPTAATVPTGNVASGVTFNVSALTPATTYYVWVRSNCGAGSNSNWSAISSFTTDCIGVSAFVENFDEVTVPNLPSCWNKIIRSSVVLGPFDALIETNNELTVKSPPNFVVLHSEASNPADTEVILASPNLSNLSSNNHRFKFWASGNNTSLKIGTLSTNDNTAVFTELVGNEVTINGTPAEYIVDFSGYTGPDHYIGVKLVGNFNNIYNNFANLDNIVWEPLPICPDVSDITISNTSTDTATVEWTAGTGEAEGTSFDIAVGTSSDSFPDAPYLTSTDPTKEITGLTENTTYYVWVRTVCHDINGAWIGPISFKTACAPIANFYENFNNSDTPNLPDCWSKIITGPTISQYAWIETSPYTGLFPYPNISVELNNESSGDSPENKIILVSPQLSTLSLGSYRLKFYAKSNNGTNVEVVTLNNNTPSATPTVVQAITLNDVTTQYVVEFDEITTDTYIGFRLKDAGFYGGIFLDNILWEESPSCADVTAINVPSTTPNTADITWTAGESETSWDIAVAPITVEDPTGLTFVSSTTNSKTVTGLDANTSYNVWVRSVCAGNDNGAWIGPVAFMTACDQVAAFVETFQNAPMPELPACWNKIISEAFYSGSIETQISYMPYETTAVLMMNKESEQTILVSPNLSTLSLGTYRLKFVAKGEGGFLEIGTLSSGTQSAEFTPLTMISTTSTPTEYTIPFDSYTGTDTYIGIRIGNSPQVQYQYIEIDNIIWQPTPLCPDVNQLSVVETTTTTGTIIWEPGIASNWEIAVGSTSDTDPDALAPYIASENPDHQITGLLAGTSYNVWVRSVCGGTNGNGYWAGPIVVTTQCDATTVPYLQDFESAATPNLPECTSAYNISDGPYNWYTGYYPGYGFENTTLIYNGDCCTDANAWFYTQGVTLTEGVNYTVSYRYGGTTMDDLYLNSLKVMYGTEATELSMTLPIADHEDFLSDMPLFDSVTITPPTTGVYYFGFNAYSDNNSYLMFVDDILIDVALANNTFDKSQFSYYPNPVKDVLNISYEKNITAVAVCNILGQEVITKSINGNIAKVDMSALAKGAYMVKVTSDNVVKTIKIIKE